MRPIDEIPESQAKDLEYVLCDIDDTLTEEGYLLPEAFDALWRLKRASFRIIPVTGRPAGWCDLIIRQWPVDAVIGENGAFAMVRDSSGYNLHIHSAVAPNEVQEKLQEIRDFVFSRVPGMKVARDQSFRWFDLALDFAEDPPRFGMETAVLVKELCESRGATAKISSIHVNTWFGNYSKLDMARELLGGFYQETPDGILAKVFFCGDSPNDETMFSFFPNSCAVANIQSFQDLLSSPPAFVTTSSYGRGFAEAAEVLLKYGKSRHL